MQPLIKLLTASMCILTVLSGCDNSSTTTDDAARTNDVAVKNEVSETNNSSRFDANFKDSIFEYEGTYVGNNSAIGNILYYLDETSGYGINNKGFHLITNKPPYGIEVGYDPTTSEQNYIQALAYYATYFFVLVENADFVTFKINQHSYSVTKEALIEWYGQDFTNLGNETALQSFFKANFKPERMNQLSIDKE